MQERVKSQIILHNPLLSVVVQQAVTVSLKMILRRYRPRNTERKTDAGHTIVHGSTTYDFHILPSGLISPSCLNLIGTGTVVHVPSFFNELEALESKGLKDVRKRIWISNRAHVCLDLHAVVDGLEEGGLGGKKVGTTGKGIGPCYSDKAARRGLRVGEILDEKLFEGKLRTLEKGYRQRFGDLKYDVEEEIGRFKVSPTPPTHLTQTAPLTLCSQRAEISY